MEVDQRIVLPGDVIEVDTESTVVLGPGLRQEGEDVVATKAGILRHLEVGNRWWIESNQKRVKYTTPVKKESTRMELILPFYSMLHRLENLSLVQ